MAAQLIELPRRAVASTVAAATAPLNALAPPNSVDDWGRDAHLLQVASPLLRFRWDVSVGGLQHLPARSGALLVTNDRRWSWSPFYVSWALAEATGRPVRFVGRPDSAPFGAALRRVGALLHNPAEVRGALRNHQLVVVGTSATNHPRRVGVVDSEIIGAAITTGVAVIAVASMSGALSRSARAEVGAPVRPRRKRRGPLAEIEVAEAVQRHLQKMLDSLGDVTPADWLKES